MRKWKVNKDRKWFDLTSYWQQVNEKLVSKWKMKDKEYLLQSL